MAKQITTHDVVAGATNEEMVALVSDLVAVASQSGRESAVIALAEEYLRHRNLRTTRLAREDTSPNLVATIGSGSPVVVMNGHLDTVPISDPGSWHTNPLTATRIRERLYGWGALDMKGSCAVMMLVAALLKPHEERLRGTLQLQLVSDEEASGHLGTGYLIELADRHDLPVPDAVLNGEYTGLRIMNAERGTFKFHVTFHGRPTHTATARVDGINPIAHAARAVLALESPLNDFHPQIGQGVRSVNMISAGMHQSQVPGQCVLLVDRRLLPGQTKDTALAEARREITEALRDCPDAQFDLAPAQDRHGRLLYAPPNLSPWDGRTVQALAKAHHAVTGNAAAPFVDWFGATDGRFFRLRGIDTASYGPSGNGAHGSNEYVEIPSLLIQLRVFVTAVLDLLTGASAGSSPQAAFTRRGGG